MKGLKLLIIEDEFSVYSFLEKFFTSHGHTVKLAKTGLEGIHCHRTLRFDLVILDLGLPDVQGLDVLKAIREWANTPTIILTARDHDEEKIQALECGADDYLTKPFNVSELHARIKAITRRSFNTDLDQKITTSNLILILESHSVFFQNQEIHLTEIEFEILKYLMMNHGKVVIHRLLLKNIWGPNSVLHTQYLRVYVGQLRKKLISAGAQKNIILTETGVGYRLND